VEHVVKRGLLFLFLAVAAVVTGCVHGHVIVAPDGQPATHVTCHHQSKCFAKAQRLCPWGYQVLDEGYRSLVFRCGRYPDSPPPEPDPDNPNTQPPSEPSPPPPAEKLYRT
jgi:hypothetical protein